MGRSFGPTGREILLVAEDTTALREVLVDLLERLGYRVLSAASGEEALVLAAAEPVDLLITDIRMPGISGVELARQLVGVPVIYMTGYSPDELTVPREDLLQKPFSPALLARRVRQRLDERISRHP